MILSAYPGVQAVKARTHGGRQDHCTVYFYPLSSVSSAAFARALKRSLRQGTDPHGLLFPCVQVLAARHQRKAGIADVFLLQSLAVNGNG